MTRKLVVAIAALASIAAGATACDARGSDGGPNARSDPAARPTFVALGDSITSPVGTGSEQDWSRWADPEGRLELLANAGVGGERTDQILARVEADVLAHQPQWVTVLAGTNDISQDVGAEPIIFNLTRIYDTLDGAGVRFVAITIPPQIMMTPEQVATHQAVNTWMRERVQADWPGSLLGDWSAALSVDGDGVSPIPEFFPDGVHLGREGAEAAGRALAPTFAAIVDAPPAP
jgi:lysophospholipase L1-like esterase